MRVELERFAYTPMGTFGVLSMDEFRCFTVERPWLNNKPSVSCIPRGIYTVKFGRFHRGGYNCYELLDVPGRSLIKIHVGNTMDDVIGCIAVGKGLGYVNDLWAVTSSRKAYDEFMRLAGLRSLRVLKISDVYA